MTNDDPAYVWHLEQALRDAEGEIKYLESHVRELEEELTKYQHAETLDMIAGGEAVKCGCNFCGGKTSS